ncbi:hypothetical protein EDB80DRAFT_589722, partial [Ilyonectria destructans]
QSVYSNNKKLELAIKYIQDNLYFSISNFIKVLLIAKGAASSKRRAIFSKAIYKDLAVLKIYIGDNNSIDNK